MIKYILDAAIVLFIVVVVQAQRPWTWTGRRREIKLKSGRKGWE